MNPVFPEGGPSDQSSENRCSPHQSLSSSSFEQSTNHTPEVLIGEKNNIRFAPRKVGSYRGYSVWVNNDIESGTFDQRQFMTCREEKVPETRLRDRDSLVSICGSSSWFRRLFAGSFRERPDYQNYLDEIDNYRRLCRRSFVSKEEKLKKLEQLSKHCSILIEHLKSGEQSGGLDRVEQGVLACFREEMSRLEQEAWYIMGLSNAGKGKVYLSRHESSSRENFASGQSATVARVFYQDGFEAVFKPTGHEQMVVSAAAQEFGLTGLSGLPSTLKTEPNTGFSEVFVETAPERVKHPLLYYQLDRLLGVDVASEICVSEDRTEGYVEKQADVSYGVIEFADEPVDTNVQARMRDSLFAIFLGNVPDYSIKLQLCYQFTSGYQLSEREKERLCIDTVVEQVESDGTPVIVALASRFPVNHRTSQGELEQLHLEGKLTLCRQVAKTVPLDPVSTKLQQSVANLELMDYLMGVSVIPERQLRFYREADARENDYCFEINNGAHRFLLVDTPQFSFPKQLDLLAAKRVLCLSIEQITDLAVQNRLTEEQTAAFVARFSDLQAMIRSLLSNEAVPEQCRERVRGGLPQLVNQWGEESLSVTRRSKSGYLYRYVLKPRENVPQRESCSAQQARLANRAVLFCEMDSLFGIHQTPETWYAEHRGVSGYCQAFVENAKEMVAERFCPLPDDEQALYFDSLLDILQGGVPDVGLQFAEGYEFPKGYQPNETELEQLFQDGHLCVTKRRVMEVLALDPLSSELQKQMADAQLLDFLCGSVDRNPGNFLYVEQPGSDGRGWLPKMIDNDLSFFSRMVVTNTDLQMSISTMNALYASMGFPSRIDRSTAERICSIDLREVVLLAQIHLLPVEDTAALLDRCNALKDCLKALLNQEPIPESCVGYVKGDVQIVDRWDMLSYRDSVDDRNSYLRRHIVEPRTDRLLLLRVTNPQLMAKTISELMPTLGPKLLVAVFDKYTPEQLVELMQVYAQHHRSSGLAGAHQTVIFVNEYIKSRRDTLKGNVAEQKAELLAFMLGQQCDAKTIAQAIYWSQVEGCLDREMLDVLLAKLKRQLREKPLRQRREPSRQFRDAFPHLCTPDISRERRALLEHCFAAFSDQKYAMELVPVLIAWDKSSPGGS